MDLTGSHKAAGGPPSRRLLEVLAAASFLGALTGLVEGALLIVLQRTGWLTWEASLVGHGIEQLWASPVFDLMLFLAVGTLWVTCGLLLPRIPLEKFALFSFSFLMFLAWLMASGWLSQTGSLMLAAGLTAVLVRACKPHLTQMMTFFRRSAILALLAVPLAYAAVEGGKYLGEERALAGRPAPASGAPNVLVIVVDTLRADHVSALGYHRPTTPNIDRLAREGVTFENGVATSSWTLPSHASLLTGRFARDHGGLGDYYRGDYLTLGQVFQSRGYRTAAFSGNVFYFTRKNGFGQGFDHFEDYYHSALDIAGRSSLGKQWSRALLPRLGYLDHPSRKGAPMVSSNFVAWLRRDPQRPFFAVLNYFDAHDPYFPPLPFRVRFAKQGVPGGIVNSAVGHTYLDLSPEELESEIAAYDGAIAYIDHNLELILEEMARDGVLKNTIVVITSDHGESFGEHHLTAHRTSLYWELLRVPIVVWAPGRAPAGVRVTQPVSIAAVPATILDLLDGTHDSPFPVSSLRRFWESRADPVGELPLSDLIKRPFPALRRAPVFSGDIQSVVDRKWHYIRHDTLGEELYDWGADPREEHNMVDTPEGHEVKQRLAAYLDERLKPDSRAARASNRKP